MTLAAEERTMSNRKQKERGIQLTAKGLDVKDGDIVTKRWALTHEGKTVYVYDLSMSNALETGGRHFKCDPQQIDIEKAGHVEWRILEPGTKRERAAQKTYFLGAHDVSELIDNQHERRKK